MKYIILYFREKVFELSDLVHSDIWENSSLIFEVIYIVVIVEVSDIMSSI
jgi:hypothetical protein